MKKQTQTLGVISLGCSKNLVDTEMAIGLMKENGFQIVTKPEEADVLLINTCGFIESAKEEAIDTILEMAEYKKKRCKTIIVMGCLVQRYKEELQKAIPEVDLWIRFQDYDTFWEQVKSVLKPEREEQTKLDFRNRVISTGDHYVYVRIAEGCSNHCTYCAIPSIRGPFRSRPLEDIIEETKAYAEQGYQEVILIAQDTTKYGVDLYGQPKLVELLKELEKINSLKWIRFLYAYPETITDELIEVVKKSQKICYYFDIPIQHIADPVLKRMNRHSNGKTIRDLMVKLRKEIPDVVIRTTVMVGFPGETKVDFEELKDFVKEAKFDKMGAFAYSKEEGTPAERLKDQVHPSTKKSRYCQIMELQQEISRQNLKEKIGKTVEVFVEGKTYDGKFYLGRSYMDVPDMDGVVILKAEKDLEIGKFYFAKITDVREYDLIAEIC